LNYKELLLNNKIIRQLSLIQIFAYFGAWFSHVAIYTMLVEFEASATQISLVVAMNFLPSIILSVFSGSLVDRLPLKRFMVSLLVLEVIMTSMFFFINSLEDIYLLMIFLFIRMASASIFFTSEMTLLPKILDDKLLSKANEIHSIIWSFTFTAGMALGGVVVHNFGIHTAFTIDIIFFLIAIFIFINTKINLSHTKATTHIFSDIKDGLKYILENKKLIHYMVLHGTVGFTAFDSLVTLLADYEYKNVISIALAIGITNATRAAALMIGPFFITNWIDKKRLFYLFLVQGVTIFTWGLLQNNFYIALIGVFLTGLVTTTLWSYTYAMLQEEVDKKYLGRVLSYNEMIFMIFNIFTTLFIGFMATLVSLDIITFIIAGLFILTAFYYKRIFL
jgi:MFS family permease